jgi:hypothetical protein
MKISIKINADTSIIAETFNSSGDECIKKLDDIFSELLKLDFDEKKEDFYKTKIKIESEVTLKNHE